MGINPRPEKIMSNQINLGSVNPAAGVGANPLAAISEAIAQFPHIQRQQQQDKEDRQFLLQQRQTQKQQQDIELAQNKLNMLKPVLLGDPQKATDPGYIGVIKQIHDTLGVPAPLNQDGSINLDEFKTPFSSLDERTVTSIMQLPKEQRKVALSRYSGVPGEALTTDAYIAAKDQAALQRAKVAGIHEGAWENIQNSRTQISAERTKAYEMGNYARAAELDALTNKAKADTQRIVEQTREMPIKLQQAQQRIEDMLQRTKQIAQRGSAGGFQYTRLLNSEASSASRLFTQADNAYESQLKAYQTALSNNADPESPEMQAAKQQLDDTASRRDALKSTYTNAQNFLSGEASALATGGHVSGATGNPTSVIPQNSKPIQSAPGVPDGTTGGGGKYVARGGQWYAK